VAAARRRRLRTVELLLAIPSRLAVASVFPISAMTSVAYRDAAQLSRDEQKVPVCGLGVRNAARMLLGISIHSGTVECKRRAENGKPTGSPPPEWPVVRIAAGKVHSVLDKEFQASPL